MRNKIFVMLCLALVSMPVLAGNKVTDLLVNGNFETGDLTGWTAVDSGSGAVQVYSGTTSPISGFPVPAPPDGTFAAISDQTGPGQHILYQDVAIPGGEGAAYFLATVYYDSQAPITDAGNLDHTGAANQQFRVDIMNPAAPVDDVGAGVLESVFRTLPGDPQSMGYTDVRVNLSAYKGQTVRVRFAEVDNQLFFQAAIDRAQMLFIVPVEVPVDSRWALLLLLSVLSLTAYRAMARRQQS